VRLLPGVHHLRNRRTYPIVRRALCAGRDRFGVRVIDFSVDKHDLHLIVETPNATALGRSMKGLGVRIARRLNKAAGRKGQVIAHRYHARALKTPGEVRSALIGVLQNAKRGCRKSQRAIRASRAWVDPYSSAAYFEGWSPLCQRYIPSRDAPDHPLHRFDREVPIVRPSRWLRTVGWLGAGGPIDTSEQPSIDGRDESRQIRRRGTGDWRNSARAATRVSSGRHRRCRR
jgi:hypothetical protein